MTIGTPKTRDTLEPITFRGNIYPVCAGVVTIPHPEDPSTTYQVNLVHQETPGGKELKRKDWYYEVLWFENEKFKGRFIHVSYEGLMRGLDLIIRPMKEVS